VVELALGEVPFEESARVDARRRVPLEEDLVASFRRVRPAEEVVEPDLVQAGRGRVGCEVAAEAREPVVRPEHHRDRVPADHPPDPKITQKVGFILRERGVK